MAIRILAPNPIIWSDGRSTPRNERRTGCLPYGPSAPIPQIPSPPAGYASCSAQCTEGAIQRQGTMPPCGQTRGGQHMRPSRIRSVSAVPFPSLGAQSAAPEEICSARRKREIWHTARPKLWCTCDQKGRRPSSDQGDHCEPGAPTATGPPSPVAQQDNADKGAELIAEIIKYSAKTDLSRRVGRTHRGDGARRNWRNLAESRVPASRRSAIMAGNPRCLSVTRGGPLPPRFIPFSLPSTSTKRKEVRGTHSIFPTVHLASRPL